MQLYSLTNVPSDRQKILISGKQLKQDTDLSTITLKPKQVVMLMGSVYGLKASDQATISAIHQQNLQDLNESQQILIKPKPGLVNLGNTCYLNSTIQVLNAIPELKEALLVSLDENQKSSNIVTGLANLYSSMSNLDEEAFNPMLFLTLLRQKYRQFAEKNRETGMYAQQDADECWSAILTEINHDLKLENGKSFVERFMTGEMNATSRCLETNEENEKAELETFIKLSCHINIKTNFMIDGITQALVSRFEKFSSVLNRNAEFEKTCEITKLPQYLVINFVRFYWKASISKKAKIMRKVKFPFELDATQFCATNLKSKLILVRDEYREINRLYEEAQKARVKASDIDSNIKYSVDQKAQEITAEQLEYQAKLKGLIEKYELDSIIDQKANATGLYDLVGILTHKGASADSGHYQAWIKVVDTDSNWMRFNDDEVTVVDREKIQQLEGGGESDVAYIMLYKAKSLNLAL